MSRLDEIRERLAMPAETVVKLSTEHRQIIGDAKALMDVVEATLGIFTPEKMARLNGLIAAEVDFDHESTKSQYAAKADAWEGLA